MQARPREQLADSGTAAFEAESVESCRSLSIDPADLFRPVSLVRSSRDAPAAYVDQLPASSISIKYTESENAWKATLNAKVDQLKAAPEFRYEGKWKR